MAHLAGDHPAINPRYLGMVDNPHQLAASADPTEYIAAVVSLAAVEFAPWAIGRHVAPFVQSLSNPGSSSAYSRYH